MRCGANAVLVTSVVILTSDGDCISGPTILFNWDIRKHRYNPKSSHFHRLDQWQIKKLWKGGVAKDNVSALSFIAYATRMNYMPLIREKETNWKKWANRGRSSLEYASGLDDIPVVQKCRSTRHMRDTAKPISKCDNIEDCQSQTWARNHQNKIAWNDDTATVAYGNDTMAIANKK